MTALVNKDQYQFQDTDSYSNDALHDEYFFSFLYLLVNFIKEILTVNIVSPIMQSKNSALSQQFIYSVNFFSFSSRPWYLFVL